MRTFGLLSLLAAVSSLVAPALGHRHQCHHGSSTGITGMAAAGESYWFQNIKHQGIAAFNTDPSNYQVFRNVKDFGAVGDGVADDTAAIKSVADSSEVYMHVELTSPVL